MTTVAPSGPPRAVLNRAGPHRILNGHPWVYSSEIQQWGGAPAPGDLAVVCDQAGRPIAQGFANPRSRIVVRAFAGPTTVVDDAFWATRLDEALAYRERVLPGRPARRLVNSESDRIPGLIVDQYGDVLAIQCTTAGADRLLPLWTRLLSERCAPAAIIERNDLPVREHEGLPRRNGVIAGTMADGQRRVRVGAVDLPWDPRDAHKTGLYLDQQRNWETVAGFVRPGARVLDAFCHLGGFALHALAAGAAHAVALDSAAAALAGARTAATWAGAADRLTASEANAFDWLRAASDARERFDLVVLDPPSFTRTRDAVAGALRGYKEIHLRALTLLPPGGTLATFTCSHHISAAEFLAVIVAAAADAGRHLRREAVLGASPDHPVLAAVPETEYLKGFVFTAL